MPCYFWLQFVSRCDSKHSILNGANQTISIPTNRPKLNCRFSPADIILAFSLIFSFLSPKNPQKRKIRKTRRINRQTHKIFRSIRNKSRILWANCCSRQKSNIICLIIEKSHNERFRLRQCHLTKALVRVRVGQVWPLARGNTNSSCTRLNNANSCLSLNFNSEKKSN